MQRNLQLQRTRALQREQANSPTVDSWVREHIEYQSVVTPGQPTFTVTATGRNPEAFRRLREERRKLTGILDATQQRNFSRFSRWMPEIVPEAATQNIYVFPAGFERIEVLMQRRWTVPQALLFFQNMLDFLTGLFFGNVIHGHLRPHTVWVHPETFAIKILDWSYALTLGNDRNEATKFSHLPEYVPEIWFPADFHAGRPATAYLDQFAAITLLQLLNGPRDIETFFPAHVHNLLHIQMVGMDGSRTNFTLFANRWRAYMLDLITAPVPPLSDEQDVT